MAILPYKISTLIFVRNESGDYLLMERAKSPNQGLWSPIGGKLDMPSGESPFEAAIRETHEEIGLPLSHRDLHLWGMFTEKNYEGRLHWLMFMFHCRKTLPQLPPPCPEGTFAFIPAGRILELELPATDRHVIWPTYFNNPCGFTSLSADCSPRQPLEITVEQTLPGPTD